MKLLVLGAGGQVGRELCRLQWPAGYEIAACEHAGLDIAQGDQVLAAVAGERLDIVINAAAYTAVDRAESEREAAWAVNAAGPANLAAACRDARIPLIHISTDYVFDGKKAGAYAESDAIAPLGVYGRSKASGEAAVRAAAVRHIILRTSWVYGEFGNNFLKTILRLAQDRDELRIVADQRGCPTSTRDIAEAILRIVPKLTDDKNLYGTYHFAGTGATTWHGFASRIIEAQAQITGRSPRVTAITTADYPTAARRPANSVLDCGLFERTFGFRANDWSRETDAITKKLAGLQRMNIRAAELEPRNISCIEGAEGD